LLRRHPIGDPMTGFGAGTTTTLIVRHIQTRQVLALAPWSKLTYETRINAAGPLNATIPSFDGGITDILLPGRVMIGVLRGSIPVWSGILWKRTMDPDGFMEVQAQEILSYWDRRRIRSTLIFTQIEQASILNTLIDLPQRDNFGALGVSVYGNMNTGVRRDRTYLAADRRATVNRSATCVGSLGHQTSSPIPFIRMARGSTGSPLATLGSVAYRAPVT